MKHILTLLTFASFSAFASTAIVPASIEQLFIPKGFDNNDNIEMTVAGKLPDSCHTRHMVSSSIEGFAISVKITSLKSGRTNCDKITTPFTENVTLGTLETGAYAVTVNGKNMGTLSVDAARNTSVDNHVYAQIDYVEFGFAGGLSGSAMLVGRNIASCLEVDRVEYISNGVDTISVLPIMKRKTGDCSEIREYLEIPITFDAAKLPADKTLLFVRTMDGKSVSGLIVK